MEPKETLISKTLESLDGMGRAKANPYLFQKVMNRMQTQLVKPETLRWAVIIAVLFISINILSLVHYNKSTALHSAGYNAIEKDYFSYLNNPNI